MEYINGVSSLYIRKFKRKLEQYNKPMRLPEYFSKMIGDKSSVRIAEVGAGPICTIGNEYDGHVEVEVIASDILANEYGKLWHEHKAVPIIPVEYANIESLHYEDESFDIVHCVNAIDHTQNAREALSELERICKKGGWVYLRHSENQKSRFGGHHFWDMRYIHGKCQLHGEYEIIIYPFEKYETSQDGELITAIWQKI